MKLDNKLTRFLKKKTECLENTCTKIFDKKLIDRHVRKNVEPIS